jgi:coenzyme F420-0:L-glutamate ligase/coenzyme F420-1:gamma-L-glutamate ligase
MTGLSLIALAGIPLIQPGDDLAGIIYSALTANRISLEDGDILVLAQKIVSKAEGRLVNLATIKPSNRAIELARQTDKDPRLVEVILHESREVLRTRPGTIIVEHRLGFVCASAGVDHSNVCKGMEPGSRRTGSDDWVLLLPDDPDASAARIREKLESVSGKRLGVLIIDSHGRAWRLGTVGVAIGVAGLPALVDLRGMPDLAGYVLKITLVAAADELAAAASLIMGQASEGTPVVHVRGYPYPLREGTLKELLRPRQEDMFR